MCADKNESTDNVEDQNIQTDTKTEVKPNFVDYKAIRMMEKMGYKSGHGLGKNEQGITNPIKMETQLGNMGLGLQTANRISDEKWDFSIEEVNVEEKLLWVINQTTVPYSHESMKQWVKEGEPLRQMTDQTYFCDEEIVQNVLKAKDIFDRHPLSALNKARSKANLFETIGPVFFMNRAALKMANIDAATDFLFTNIDENQAPVYFADVCAGPGGFSEYLLWRNRWLYKGFGFTLRDEHDFKIKESNCVSSVNFHQFYGAKEDGDVCCPENVKDFSEKVLHETDGEGVHFMMSDGGFSVEGNEDIQEILSKNIYICQCLVCLEIVRKSGHFVTKLFDIFTLFSIGLLYLMYKCFKKIAILKPNSSRPANSERYLICYGLLDSPIINVIRNYLRGIVLRLWELKDNENLDIIEIVPLDVIRNDKEFCDYITESNNKLGRRQIISLDKMEVFCRNPLLVEPRQDKLRSDCLKFWKIPDCLRQPLTKYSTDSVMKSAIEKQEILLVQPREINNLKNLNVTITDLSNWHYCPMQCNRQTNFSCFYVGIGSSRAYKYNIKYKKWVNVKNLYLYPGSLVYGEMVIENYKNEKEETVRKSLHIIDALRLGDKSLHQLKFEERLQLIGRYCKAINHEHRENYVRVRHKVIKPLQSLLSSSVFHKNVTNSNYIVRLPVLGFKMKNEYFDVNSMLLLKTDDSQSFHSTYVLRVQIFLSQTNQDGDFSESTFVRFLNDKFTIPD